MIQSKIVGVVEIGTAKVVVLIAEIVKGRTLTIIGMGQATSQGVKKGEIVDFKSASHSVHAAIMVAEKNAGTQIENLYLSQSGGGIKGFFHSATVNVSAFDGQVTRRDITRVVEEAKSKKLPLDRVYIHHIQHPFKIDGRVVEDPLGMQGEKLEVGYWSIHGEEQKIRDHIHIINGYGLNVEDVIFSGVASGVIVTEEAEKKNGVLVLDIGCGTTDYVLYKEGYVLCTGVVPVGGDHITNDLSMGLRIGRKNAERIKLEMGKAVLDKADWEEKFWVIGDQGIGDRSMKKKTIYQIIQARVEELFQVVAREIGGLSAELAAGVVLTGGSAHLPGIEIIAADVFGKKVCRKEGPSWVHRDLCRPEFSTALGLLYYALTGQLASIHVPKETRKGVFQKIAKIFALRE